MDKWGVVGSSRWSASKQSNFPWEKLVPETLVKDETSRTTNKQFISAVISSRNSRSHPTAEKSRHRPTRLQPCSEDLKSVLCDCPREC